MTRNTRGTLIKFVIPVLLLAAVLATVVAVAALPGSPPSDVGAEADTGYPTIPTWPQFSMVYETGGHAYTVGQNPAVVTRETRRLEFSSRDQWTETVTAAPDVETRVGTFNAAGSYRRMDGRTYTEYDALTDTMQEEEVEEGVIRWPFMMPFPIEESGYEFTLTTTAATVCFMGECQENAGGLLLVKPSGAETVFVNDARGIPLRIGDAPDGFIVREIRVNDAQQPVELDEQPVDNEEAEDYDQPPGGVDG